jgi:glutathione S-transferase
MSKLTLYSNPMSRGLIAQWMLAEVGVPFEMITLSYGPDMQTPEFLAINPMGKVPCLIHDCRIVTEAAAICLYLADEFPQCGLGPTPDERADYYRWILFAAGPIEQAAATKALGVDSNAFGSEQQGQAGFGSQARVENTLSTLLSERAYVCGDRFTAADVYFGSQIDWGLYFGTLKPADSITRYAERLRARPAYKAARGEAGNE